MLYLVLKTFKYRLYPSKSQGKILEERLGICRELYNSLLNTRISSWSNKQKGITFFDQCNAISGFKGKHPELKKIHSQTLQNIALRIDLAFKSFFRRVKEGQKPGYPRFKEEGRYDSITFPQFPNGCQIKDGKLKVFGIGNIKIVIDRPIEGTSKTSTIKRSSTGKWYVSFSCELGAKRLEPKITEIGIDVGLNSFATFSNREKIENPRFFRKDEKELGKAQRRLSKFEKGAEERVSGKKVVSRIHERIRFRRDDFAHQNSRKIVNEFGVIAVEDIEVNKMLHNHCLAKSISDASWSKFLACLLYKAEEAGRSFIRVNPAYTSQDCSGCGHRQQLKLSDRIYKCHCCNLEIDRDVNAAKNILRLGLQSLAKA